LDLLKRVMAGPYYNELAKKDKQLLTMISKNVSLIQEDDGQIVGRLALYDNDYSKDRLPIEGKVTIGGMNSSRLSGLLGILIGKSDRASRDVGIPVVSSANIKKWATSQSELLSKLNLVADTEIKCASIIRALGGDTLNLKIAHHKSGTVNYEELKNIIHKTNSDSYLVVQDAAINIYERDKNCKISFFDNVLWVDVGIPGILQTGNFRHETDWPEIDNLTKERFRSRTLEGLTTEAFSEVWKITTDAILANSDLSSDEKNYEASVGKVNEEDAIIDHLDIIRRTKKK
jgi:hypothetical protein